MQTERMRGNMKHTIVRAIKIIIKVAVSSFNILTFCMFTYYLYEEWQGWNVGQEKAYRYYAKALERGEAPYWDQAMEILAPYLLPEWHIERESCHYDPYHIRVSYECWLMEGERDIVGFYVTVSEKNESSDSNGYPLGESRYVLQTDLVQQVFCNTLIDCNEAYYQARGHYVFVPLSSMRRNDHIFGFMNYYGGLEFDVVASKDKEGMEWLFGEAYKRMYAWQQRTEAAIETDFCLAAEEETDERQTYHLAFREAYDDVAAEQFDRLIAEILAYADSKRAKKVMEYYAAWMRPQTDGPDAPDEGGTYHSVRRGDCLWELAATYYGSGALWHIIYEDNRAVIGADADLLREGCVLFIRER